MEGRAPFHTSQPGATDGGTAGLRAPPGDVLIPIGGWLAKLRAATARLLPGQARPVEHVACGTFCHVASSLRTAGLRRWSGPFDWIFTTPGMIADCIADDFASLLDPRYLVSVPPAELTNGAKKQCRHLLYEARYGLPTVFNHHDPAASPSDLRSLERAVARMRATLRGNGSTLLYMMSEVPWPESDIARLAGLLGALPSRNTLAVLTVRGGSGAERSWSLRRDAGDLLQANIVTEGRSNGLRFPNREDEALFGQVLMSLAARRDPTVRPDRAP
ncbi:MAG: hypothetical protein JWR08_318 [Enterovirga sp.]|nr:hypothetical protein [Enterovirga sp.]